MKKLPIKACLITRNEFRKIINLYELQNYIRIPLFPKGNPIVATTSQIDFPKSIEYMEFYLEDFKEIKQSDGFNYIAAKYKEV